MPSIRTAVLRPWICLFALLALVPLPLLTAQARRGIPRAQRHEFQHEIERLEQEWVNAVLHRNVQLMDSLLAEDYTAITANGTLQSKQQMLDSMRDGTLHFSSIELSDRKVRFYGRTALVTSRAVVNGSTPNGDIKGSYRYTRVYVRDPRGNWKIVSFETSKIRPSMDHD